MKPKLRALRSAAGSVMVTSIAATASTQAAWTLLDNFDTYDNSANTKTIEATGGVWSSEFAGTNNSHVLDSDQGQSLMTAGGAAWRGAERDLTGTDAAVLVGETQTYFWQVKASSTGGAYDFMMGLSPSVANIDSVNAWQDFSVMPFINNGATTPYINAAGPGTYWAAMSPDTWFNVWVVVNNDAVDPTFDLYYSAGTDAATLVIADADWRNFAAGSDLNAIGFMAAGEAGSQVLVDNIYYASGVDTTNPLMAVPEPHSALLGGVGVLALLRRRRNG